MRINAEVITRMQRLRSAGMCNREIGKALGFTGRTVCKHIGHEPSEVTARTLSAAVKRIYALGRPAPEDTQIMREMREGGATYREIGKRFGISDVSVLNRLRKGDVGTTQIRMQLPDPAQRPAEEHPAGILRIEGDRLVISIALDGIIDRLLGMQAGGGA